MMFSSACLPASVTPEPVEAISPTDFGRHASLIASALKRRPRSWQHSVDLNSGSLESCVPLQQPDRRDLGAGSGRGGLAANVAEARTAKAVVAERTRRSGKKNTAPYPSPGRDRWRRSQLGEPLRHMYVTASPHRKRCLALLLRVQLGQRALARVIRDSISASCSGSAGRAARAGWPASSRNASDDALASSAEIRPQRSASRLRA
jgi:hypothetical protein